MTKLLPRSREVKALTKPVSSSRDRRVRGMMRALSTTPATSNDSSVQVLSQLRGAPAAGLAPDGERMLTGRGHRVHVQHQLYPRG